MAAMELGGTTLHHWAGIGDNRFTKEKALQVMDDGARARIRQADTLILDEIGMISAAVFEKVEHITRHVRETDQVFGGLQVCNIFYKRALYSCQG